MESFPGKSALTGQVPSWDSQMNQLYLENAPQNFL